MDELKLWRELASAAAQMAHSAEASDWDRLTATYREFETCLGSLTRAGSRPLSQDERDSKAQLIRSILASFETVKSRAVPWMDDVRPLLDAWNETVTQA